MLARVAERSVQPRPRLDLRQRIRERIFRNLDVVGRLGTQPVAVRQPEELAQAQVGVTRRQGLRVPGRAAADGGDPRGLPGPPRGRLSSPRGLRRPGMCANRVLLRPGSLVRLRCHVLWCRRTTVPPHHFRGGQKPARMTITRLAGTPRRRRPLRGPNVTRGRVRPGPLKEGATRRLACTVAAGVRSGTR